MLLYWSLFNLDSKKSCDLSVPSVLGPGRIEGAEGIMFPGCPSVRPDFRPDLRPDFFVYAITQVLLDGISSNLVQGSTTRSRWTD